jgi:hypothetical protein
VDAVLNWFNGVRDLRGSGAPLFPGRHRGGRWRISCGGLVFLVHTTRDDPDRVVGQRLGPVLETIENALRAD